MKFKSFLAIILAELISFAPISPIAPISIPAAHAQASQLPLGKQCFQAVTGVNGMVGTIGAITGGTGYVNGSYGGVPLTGGSGTNATANITVAGGIVSAVTILNPGAQYVVGDVLSATASTIGGSGSGFSFPVASTSINSSLAGGSVAYYIPSTLTIKQTWQDSGETILNQNPVPLDTNGCALVYGSGTYRQIVKDSLNNTVWDVLTSSPSGSSGGGVASTQGVMVGTIMAWANTTLPPLYLYAAGQAVNRAAFPQLLTALTFNITITCSITVASISVPTAVSDYVPIGAPVEAPCFAPGTVVSSKSSGLLNLSNAATTSVSTAAVIFPWGDGDQATTFNVPDLRGRSIAGRDNMNGSVAGVLTTQWYAPSGTINPDSANAIGGNQTSKFALNNLPPYTPTGTITNGAITINGTASNNTPATTAVVGSGGNAGSYGPASLSASQAASTFTGTSIGGGSAASATVAAGGSGYTTGLQTVTLTGGTCSIAPQFSVTGSAGAITAPTLITAGACSTLPTNPAAISGGGGTGGTLTVTYGALPFSLMQPSLTADYIIKALPDASPTGPGVSSIGGMTGIIACGSGVTCNANTISVSAVSTGTPGAIAYFNTVGTLAATGVMTSGNPIVGGGAGGTPVPGARSGNTTTFGTTSGALTSGDCLKADVNGNIVDNGAACGANSNTPHTQDFIGGTDFTAGTTTSLTLSSTPSSTDLLSIFFDGVEQSGASGSAATWSLAGAVVTFNAAIPTNTKVVEAKWSTSATLAGVGSITAGASTLTGAVTLAAGAGVTLTPAGQTITVATSAGALVAGPTTSITTAGGSSTIGNDLGWVSIMDSAYGAKCNAVLVSSGTVSINSSSTALTVTGANFTSADVTSPAKSIWIPGAGPGGAGLSTTITSFVSSIQVGVGTPASTNVSSAALSQGNLVAYGNDDTAAINAAIAAVPPFGTLYINPITLSFPVRGCLIKQSGATGRSLIVNNPINIRGGGNLSALITDPSMGTTVIDIHALVSGQSWKGIRWEGFTLGTDTNFTPMTRYGSYGIWFDATSAGPGGFQGLNIGPNLALGESNGGFYTLVLDGVGSQGNRIENNFITGGIDISQTADSNMILNNRLLGVSTFGIHVDTPSAGNFIFSGNSTTLAAGVCILNGSGTIVSNNFFEEEISAVQYPHNAFLDIGCSSGQSMSSTTVTGNIILAGSSSSSTPIKIDANTGFTYVYGNEIATSTARPAISNANASTTVGPNQIITSSPHCSGTAPTLWGVAAC